MRSTPCFRYVAEALEQGSLSASAGPIFLGDGGGGMVYDVVIEILSREGSEQRGSAVQRRAAARRGGYRAYCAAYQQGWRVPEPQHGPDHARRHRRRGGCLAAHRVEGGERASRRRRRHQGPGRAPARRAPVHAGPERAGSAVPGSSTSSSTAWTARGPWRSCAASRSGARATRPGVAVSAVRHGNARPASWTSALASHDTDGVILVTSELTAGPARAAARRRASRWSSSTRSTRPTPDLASVGATNWAGGLAATDHLLSLGHRRIAAIAGPPTTCAAGPGSTVTVRRSSGPGSRSTRRSSGTVTSSTRAASCAAVNCSTWPSGRPRSSPATTSRPSASTRRRGSAGCGFRRT